MLYMKMYSEILLSWGLQAPAIEICKIISKADSLIQTYQNENMRIQKRQSTSLTQFESLKQTRHALAFLRL